MSFTVQEALPPFLLAAEPYPASRWRPQKI
jgi:hypothetical protein